MANEREHKVGATCKFSKLNFQGSLYGAVLTTVNEDDRAIRSAFHTQNEVLATLLEVYTIGSG